MRGAGMADEGVGIGRQCGSRISAKADETGAVSDKRKTGQHHNTPHIVAQVPPEEVSRCLQQLRDRSVALLGVLVLNAYHVE